MKKYTDSHPDPDGELWTVKINPEIDQEVVGIKEMTVAHTLGNVKKAYALLNKNGEVVAMQFYDKPEIEEPIKQKNPKTGFKNNFSLPEEIGLFPPYKVLVNFLKS